MDGGLLIRVKESEQEKAVEGARLLFFLLFFFFIIRLNAAGSLQQVWPDLAVCFVRSVVTLLTRSVLTQTSLLRAT